MSPRASPQKRRSVWGCQSLHPAPRTFCTACKSCVPSESPVWAFARLSAANCGQALVVLYVPCGHRRRLRTTNGPDLLSNEFKRGTHVTAIFPVESSLHQFVSAVLAEIIVEWQVERACLNMETRWTAYENGRCKQRVVLSRPPSFGI